MTDQSTYAPIVLGVTCLFWSLAVVVAAVRLYARSRVIQFWGLDDWWIAAAILFATADQALKIMWCLHGLGRHLDAVSLSEIEVFLKLSYAIPVQYPFALGCVKISILTFYLRVFPQKAFRKFCFGAMAIIVAATLSIALGQAFACTPISDAWRATPTGYCVNKAALQTAGSVINLATDLIVLLLPLKYLLALALDERKRYSIVALFSLGMITCVASAYRLSTIPRFYASNDPTWSASSIAIWSGIEINLSIITASIPAVKAFVTSFIFKSCDEIVSRNSRSLGQNIRLDDRYKSDEWKLVEIE